MRKTVVLTLAAARLLEHRGRLSMARSSSVMVP